MSSTPTNDVENESANAIPNSLNNSPMSTMSMTDTDHAYIAAQIGEGAKNVNVGKDIKQTVIEGNIGTFIYNLWSGSKEPSQHLRARKILLENVAKFWVDGVLKDSLHNEGLLSLDLEERPSVVDNRPWQMVLQTPAQSDHLLPPGTTILEVFKQHQSLLILGAPGAGKTTMLLELARDLITQAQQDANQPIPVVLNLSSWIDQRQSLESWLVAELNSKYYISPKISQIWVMNDNLLVLLDGLDEVQQAQRDACVDAINAFCKTHGVPLAVCCRLADYEELIQPLQLQSAVVLQPLAQHQIDDFFARMGDDYKAMRIALQKDPVLQEFATSPLLLGIMNLAYREAPPDLLDQQQPTVYRRKHLFDAYIQRMFVRRSPAHPYPRHQTLQWLKWLAQNMLLRQQTIFLIERLQPDWLQSPSHIWLYRFIAGFIGGLIGWLPGWFISWLNLWRVSGAFARLFFQMSMQLLGGLAGGLFVGSSQIRLAERIVFSTRLDTKRALVGVLVGGLINGICYGLISIFSFGLSKGLLSGLIFGISGALSVGIIFGLLKTKEATQQIRPNQGIWHSAQNMWIGGLSGGLGFGLLFGLINAFIVRLINLLMSINVTSGPYSGLMGGVIAGLLVYGGAACIQHLTLRILLYYYNYAPLNYASFLDYCADRIFLHKVGGGYIFIHRLMMEHFAELTEEDIKRLASSMDGRC